MAERDETNGPVRPFGLNFLVEVPAIAVAAAVALGGCGGSSKSSGSANGSTVGPGTTAPVNSNQVTTMAYSMPSAAYPTGDSF